MPQYDEVTFPLVLIGSIVISYNRISQKCTFVLFKYRLEWLQMCSVRVQYRVHGVLIIRPEAPETRTISEANA
jgi:hypothetical protein